MTDPDAAETTAPDALDVALVTGLDLGDDSPAASAPLSFDSEPDTTSAAPLDPGSWLDLDPASAPIIGAPDPNWPLGPTPSAAASIATSAAPGGRSSVPSTGPSASPSEASRTAPSQPQDQPLRAPVFEVYRPPTAPYAEPATTFPGPAARPDPAFGEPQPVPQSMIVYGRPALAPDSTTWASAAHWSSLVASFFTGGALGFVGPLIVYLAKSKTDPFVRTHAAEALNFHLTMVICMIVSLFAVILVVGVAGLVCFPLLYLICSIIGGFAASRGEQYRYPINFRMVK